MTGGEPLTCCRAKQSNILFRETHTLSILKDIVMELMYSKCIVVHIKELQGSSARRTDQIKNMTGSIAEQIWDFTCLEK